MGFRGRALVASDDGPVFGTTVASALKASVAFTAHSTGYSGTSSDGLTDLKTNRTLANQYDTASGAGNIVQTAQVPVAADTTFTLALGFGADRTSAASAATASLSGGFDAAESSYASGWHGYLTGKTVPASVSGDTLRRRTYLTGLMTLHGLEDKTYPGANVAALATPWGDSTDGNALNDGYHRVWARDLYQQGTALIAAGDAAQAKRMAQWLWDRQQITAWTSGDGVTYGPGSFPRYSPVSGVSGATAQQLGCCEQLDEDAYPIVLAWQTGLNDAATWSKIKLTADHIVAIGPATPAERWEDQSGLSPVHGRGRDRRPRLRR